MARDAFGNYVPGLVPAVGVSSVTGSGVAELYVSNGDPNTNGVVPATTPAICIDLTTDVIYRWNGTNWQ